jgi:hypothetical protein
MIEKAKPPIKARWACHPFPLETPGDPRYVDLAELFGLYRGGKNALLNDLDHRNRGRSDFHAVLAGPGGSGKTTLILQSFEEFRKLDFFPVHLDVLDELDPGNIDYSDLLLALVVRVDKELEKEGIGIDSNILESIIKWFGEILLTEEHCRELNIKFETSAGGKTGIPFVGQFVAKILAAFKGGSKYREEIRQRVDRSPNELIDRVNIYIKAATEALSEKKGKKCEILFFYDNLEKISDTTNQVDKALIKQSNLHKKMQCTVVYTIPFSLLVDPGETGRFSSCCTT